MSDLKNYLWNNQSLTSVKKKYNSKVLRLNEWPDFGFVGCPKEYIILSAYLVKQPIDYNQLKRITNCSDEIINHFIYVCNMLKIITISDKQASSNKHNLFNILSTNFSTKLKQMFF